MHIRALLLAYDPTSGPAYGCRKMRGVYPLMPDLDELVTDYVADLSNASGASHGRICIDIVQRYDIDDFPPEAVALQGPDGPLIENGRWVSRDAYFRNLEHSISLRDGKAVDVPLGGVDYVSILNDPRYGIVDKVNAGTIDMVFVLAPSMLGFWESAMAGPGAYFINGGPIDGIAVNKRFIVLFTGSDRDVGNWLHDTGHLAEWNIAHHAANWPKTWTYNGRRYNDWERFTLTESLNYSGPTDGGVAAGFAQMGDVHFPPNAMDNYDYDNERSVDSYAPDWERYDQWFNNPRYTMQAPARVNKSTWGPRHPPDDDYGGHQRGFLYWWFSHIPHFEGRHGIVRNDWWPYIFDPNLEVAAASAQTPSR